MSESQGGGGEKGREGVRESGGKGEREGEGKRVSLPCVSSRERESERERESSRRIPATGSTVSLPCRHLRACLQIQRHAKETNKNDDDDDNYATDEAALGMTTAMVMMMVSTRIMTNGEHLRVDDGVAEQLQRRLGPRALQPARV